MSTECRDWELTRRKLITVPWSDVKLANTKLSVMKKTPCTDICIQSTSSSLNDLFCCLCFTEVLLRDSALLMMSINLGWINPRRGRPLGSPLQHCSIRVQHSSSKFANRSGRTPRLTADQRWSLLEHCSNAKGRRTVPAQMYQKRIPKAYTSTLLSYLPEKSSGAMWIGVPTMEPDIMASGLQNPKSVILPRFLASN